jgi:Ca2+-binding RTX toxin-like protein
MITARYAEVLLQNFESISSWYLVRFMAQVPLSLYQRGHALDSPEVKNLLPLLKLKYDFGADSLNGNFDDVIAEIFSSLPIDLSEAKRVLDIVAPLLEGIYYGATGFAASDFEQKVAILTNSIGNLELRTYALALITAEKLLMGTDAADEFSASSLNPDLKTSSVGETIIGGLGNDALNGYSGNDTYIYNNGDGIDSISENSSNGNADKLIFTGHSFAEVKVENSAANSNLTLTFTNNADSVVVVNGSTNANDIGVESFVFAGGVTKTKAELQALSIVQKQTAGADTIRGYASSNDTFVGGLGNDTLTGLSGNDTFVFAAGFGKDVITDFTAGSAVSDVLSLSLGTSFDTFAELYAAAVQVGSNTVINIGINDTITLNGVTKTGLVANDFSFF